MRLVLFTLLPGLLGCGDKEASGEESADTGESTDTARDLDGDGFVDSADGGEDCDDGDASVNPDADEVCNGRDDDCDGLLDDDDADLLDVSSWYADLDGDGFGDPDPEVLACAAPDQHVADNTDCDDTRAEVSPEGLEVCDELDLDEDCDGLADDADDSVDPSSLTTWYTDADGDGYGDQDDPGQLACDGEATEATDCDDSNAKVYPGASEGWADGLDEDCDGLVDETWLDVNEAAVTIETSATGWCCRLGWAHGIGDYTGDGIDDAAITDFSNSAAVKGGGAVYLFAGPLTGGTLIVDTDTFALVSGKTSSQNVGYALSLDYDLNGDGFHDIVGGDLYGLVGAGSAFVVHGPASGTTYAQDADLYVTGSSLDSRLGWFTTQGVGDIDGDGVVDVLFGAPWDDGAASNGGVVYLFSGTTTGSLSVTDADADIGAASPDAYLGRNAQGGVDLNGDGVDDLLLGSGPMGEVFAFHGPITGALTTADADHSLRSTAGDFGDELAAGDFDGDGVIDLAVGAPQYSGIVPSGGRVYAFSGPISSLSSEADSVFTMSGQRANDLVGLYFSDVIFDDLDSDGLDDLFVGARHASIGGGATGHIGVQLGPLSGDVAITAADQNFSSASNGGEIGNTLAVGDVDGDGELDVMSGSWEDNQGHVWLGSQF